MLNKGKEPFVSEPERTALLVRCPEAERVVGDHRALYDAAARVGVPAHITVLYPFVDPGHINAQVVERVGEIAADTAPFDLVLRRTAWFEEAVLYLAMEDPSPLLGLTTAATAAFPSHAPYEGRFADPIPHLTVAHNEPVGVLREVEKAVLPVLPVHQQVSAVELWTGPRPTLGGRGRWRRLEAFPLRGIAKMS